MTKPLLTGNIINDPMDLLHRQIPQSWLDLGRPPEFAFRPQPQDDNRVSVYWGRIVSPKESFEIHRKNGYKTEAVYSIDVAECQQVGLPLEYDPVDNNNAHSIIDYSQVTTKAERKAKGVQLRNYAAQRGPTYLPVAPIDQPESTLADSLECSTTSEDEQS